MIELGKKALGLVFKNLEVCIVNPSYLMVMTV